MTPSLGRGRLCAVGVEASRQRGAAASRPSRTTGPSRSVVGGRRSAGAGRRRRRSRRRGCCETVSAGDGRLRRPVLDPKHTGVHLQRVARQAELPPASTRSCRPTCSGRRPCRRAHPKFSPLAADQAVLRLRALSGSSPSPSPGSCTSIVVPETKIWGSPTPNASTRLRMFSSACCITRVRRAVGRLQDHRDAALQVQAELRLQRARWRTRSGTPRPRRRPCRWRPTGRGFPSCQLSPVDRETEARIQLLGGVTAHLHPA